MSLEELGTLRLMPTGFQSLEAQPLGLLRHAVVLILLVVNGSQHDNRIIITMGQVPPGGR